MAEDRKSFVVYNDIKDVLDKLTDDQVGKLFRAMVIQSNGDPVPAFDDFVLEIAFTPIRQQMVRDADKWDGTKKLRAEAGRKGGLKTAELRAKAKEANQANQANATFAEFATQQNPSKTANQAINTTITTNTNLNTTMNTTTTTTDACGGGECDDEFNIWKRLTPDDIDVLYEQFPNSGGLLIDTVYADVKAKKKKVKSGLKYILGYAKKVGWDDNAEHFDYQL